MAARPRTVVVGAGVAGLATARALTRAGIPVTVIERRSAWRPEGTGIFLLGNATRALRALGLHARVAATAAPIRRQRLCDPHGRTVSEVDLDALWRGVGPCLALHRADLHAALREGVDVRLGAALHGLDAREDGVRCLLGEGGPALEAELVVGADGLHSTVRALGLEARDAVRPLGQRAWRWVVEGHGEGDTWTGLLGARAVFLVLPIGGGRAYCYADSASNSGAVAGPEEAVAGFGGPVPELLGAARGAEVHATDLEEVVLERTTRGRIVLVGDAAHAASPNMAQGAAMALEDALVLAASLGEGSSVPAALEAFAARRRPRTAWVRAQARRRDRMRSLPGRLREGVLRRFGARIVHANYARLLAEP
jgi:FAD-dependent urate hydroxylase